MGIIFLLLDLLYLDNSDGACGSLALPYRLVWICFFFFFPSFLSLSFSFLSIQHFSQLRKLGSHLWKSDRVKLDGRLKSSVTSWIFSTCFLKMSSKCHFQRHVRYVELGWKLEGTIKVTGPRHLEKRIACWLGPWQEREDDESWWIYL